MIMLHLEEESADDYFPFTDADDSVVYPDEKLYAEEFKRDADDTVVYPDEKLYAEEFKRGLFFQTAS